jgi:ribosome-associated protein
MIALIARFRAVFCEQGPLEDHHIMLRITPTIVIDDDEIQLDFIRASGPGGQHVNRAATAVQLRFDAASSTSLPADVRERLIRLAGSRMTEEGILIVTARRFRSQERNRQDAIDRLVALVREAAEQPKRRRKTRPSQTAKQRRLNSKRLRSKKKRLRRRVSGFED